ncbi:uncharacterized protein PAN0_010c4057 [Moesziomyces antarcticus]|uniref:Uncharacterized protein n=2 Tax=Pseudozyma antarctica TaxID=84753 RepID=A0A081CGN9_PSEA2|nr:uncharacterized protein PAN0_010c4057 [Moesziomyces antarcticus]GAK65835.1 conserved hypothetical protein [Moesziomyces antarcticus]SPO45465.1 related to conserved hypothetical Ustilaginaceae-specific protein [Moesziomyces antarcticus]
MPSFADIYASCLYAAGEGLPLWNPSPLRLGDVGYVRDGSFIVLYNAVDGPAALSDAADMSLARQTDRSASRERSRAGSNASDWMDLDESSHAAGAVAASSRRSSLATSSVGSSLASVPMSRSAASDSLLSAAMKQTSPTFAHRKLRSDTPPEGPYPPMPLAVDQEVPKLFDMGPRMSSNYRCLGIDVGATVPGTPASVKIGFESSGGDGAILIPRDPTERTRLKYLGVLKAYIKAHHKWIYDTYGRIEAIGIDDLALIYGQDRTSDWAVAVSRDTARGARVEFEIFGSISSGFWGNWSHTLSACQRGPHRPKGRRNMAAAATEPDGHKAQPIHAPVVRKRSVEEPKFGTGVGIGEGIFNASFSFSPFAKKKDEADEAPVRGRSRSPPRRAHSITWSEVHAPPDQTISIRRITACTSLGGFLPARPRAAAEPRDPDVDPRRDVEGAPLSSTDGSAQDDGDGETSSDEQWSDDPLEALHAWVHEHGGARVKVSIASDDDCLRLLTLLGKEHAVAMGLQKAVSIAADRYASIAVDEDGFATIAMKPFAISSAAATTIRVRSRQSTADVGDEKENVGLQPALRALPRGAASKLRVLQPSSRFDAMLPCRSMRAFGAAPSPLVRL